MIIRDLLPSLRPPVEEWTKNVFKIFNEWPFQAPFLLRCLQTYFLNLFSIKTTIVAEVVQNKVFKWHLKPFDHISVFNLIIYTFYFQLRFCMKLGQRSWRINYSQKNDMYTVILLTNAIITPWYVLRFTIHLFISCIVT